MLIKAGVDISRLKREIRRSLNKVEDIYNQHAEDLIITSTYDGNHTPGSLHYANDAYDIRLPDNNEREIKKEIGVALGIRFVVLLEANHIHIGYDPKL